MKNLSFLLLLFIALEWNSSCNKYEKVVGQSNSESSSVKIDNIELRLIGKSSEIDDDLLKIITDPKAIQSLKTFTDQQVRDETDWRPEWDTEKGIVSPHHFLKLAFYKADKVERVFGVGGGQFKVEEYIFTTINSKADYKIKYVKRETFLEFLQLIGLSEEEWIKFNKEFDQPGGWKKKP